MRRVAAIVAAVCVTATFGTACDSDSEAVSTTGRTSTDSAPPDSAPSTTAAPTTAAPTTSASTTDPPPTASPVTEPPATAPSTAAPTTLPPFPPSLIDLPDPPDVWSVVLAGSADFDDPVLTQAVADAEAAGYFVGPTDCDEGAAEAIGMSGSGVYTITVYLNSEPDAQAAAEAFAARGVDATVALIRLFCLD